MTKLPYMPFYPADWLLDTQDLSPEAYQAYHRILCNMWLTRSKALPHDSAVLRKRAGFSPQKWPHVWSQIEGFFQIENGQVSHQRLTKEGVKAEAGYKARSQAGTKGAKARWLKSKGSGNSNANGKANDKRNNNHNHTIYKDSARTREGENLFYENGIRKADVEAIKEGKKFLLSQFTAVKARAAIEAGYVTEDECKAVGVL